MVLLHIALICVLLYALVKSSNAFVEAVIRISRHFGVSELVIGLTVVAIGTSLPELGASAMAAYSGNFGLSVSNIVGSNIAKGLILGLSAIAIALPTNKKIVRDCSVCLGVSLFFYVISLNGLISFENGVGLIAVALMYMLYLFSFRPVLLFRISSLWVGFNRAHGRVRGAIAAMHSKAAARRHMAVAAKTPKKRAAKAKRGIPAEIPLKAPNPNLDKRLAFDLLIIPLSVIAIGVVSHALVAMSADAAAFMGVSESLIGATIIAIGASFPELFVAIAAIRKKHGDLLIGTMVGSCIFNIALVMGVSALIRPLAVEPNIISFQMPFMLIMAVATLAFARTGGKFDRLEGIALLATYGVFLYLLVA